MPAVNELAINALTHRVKMNCQQVIASPHQQQPAMQTQMMQQHQQVPLHNQPHDNHQQQQQQQHHMKHQNNIIIWHTPAPYERQQQVHHHHHHNHHSSSSSSSNEYHLVKANQNYQQHYAMQVAPATPPSSESELTSGSAHGYDAATASSSPASAYSSETSSGQMGDNHVQATTSHLWIQSNISHTQQQQQQHFQNNQSQPVYMSPHQAQQQQHQHQQHHQPSQIASYYYDIDDGFSDILSAPASPEPYATPMQQSNVGAYNSSSYMIANCQQTQQQQQQQPQIYYTQDALCSSNPATPGEMMYSPMQEQQQQHRHNTMMCQQAQQQQPMQHHQLTEALSPMSQMSVCSGDSGIQTGSSRMMLVAASSPGAASSRSSVSSVSSGVQPQAQQQQQQTTTNSCRIKAEPQATHTVKPANAPAAAAAAFQRAYQPSHMRSSPIHLWEFLLELLQQVDAHQEGGHLQHAPAQENVADASVIRWLDKQRGVFKIEDSVRVAKLWGKRKNKPKMNYDKLSRSIRQYYKKGIMKKTDRSQRLVYQFCAAYCN